MLINSKNTNYKQTEIGEIPEDWDIALLSEVAKVNEASVNKDFKYEWIEYIDVSSTLKGEILETQKLSLKDAPSRAKRIVSDNDILISTVRPNLKHFAFVSKTKPNLIASTGYAVVSSKKVNPRFLYYYLTTEEYTNYLSAIADTTTSTYPAFNPDVLERSRIPFPSENEQQQIASILSSLDDKIELNRRMNKTLEEMGKALFKRWFVDFEFPNENGEPYKSNGGGMVESELGEIPRGWEIGNLSDEFEILMGQSPPGSTYNEYGVGLPFYQGRTDFGERYPSRRMFCSEPTRIARELDVLLSVRAPVGDINQANEDCCIGRGVASIRKENHPTYAYYKLLYLKNVSLAYDKEGTVFGSINKTDLSRIQITLPPISVVSKFESELSVIDRQIFINSTQIENLTSTRDLLLPRLMSGKIRVSN